MVCFHPDQGYQKKGLTKNGKFGFTTKVDYARVDKNGNPITRSVPCRKCIGCRNDYAKEWAVKIMHEASLNFDPENGVFRNSFITLTYNDDHIPAFGALDYEGHFKNFMKRLRRELSPTKIRFYMIGEYGDLNLRPHYHVIIFGYDFPDKYYHMHRNGEILYRSPLLESIWTVPRGEPRSGESYGYSSVGEVTFASAAYVARYSMKKIIGTDPDTFGRRINPDTGEIIIGRYERFHPETGEKIIVPRERALMSNGGGSGKGGIGKEWFELRAMTDLYNKDYTHMPNGAIVRAPKYYDKLLEKLDPAKLQAIKDARQQHMMANAQEFTPERLAQRETCFMENMKKFKRESRRIYVEENY